MTDDLRATIDAAWEERHRIAPETRGQVRDAVEAALDLLDAGEARVAEPSDGGWQVQQWLKKAVLLSFRLNDAAPIAGGPGGAAWFDKVPPKFLGWDEQRFRTARVPRRAGLRRAPLGLRRARRGADAVLRQRRRLCR